MSSCRSTFKRVHRQDDLCTRRRGSCCVLVYLLQDDDLLLCLYRRVTEPRKKGRVFFSPMHQAHAWISRAEIGVILSVVSSITTISMHANNRQCLETQNNLLTALISNEFFFKINLFLLLLNIEKTKNKLLERGVVPIRSGYVVLCLCRAQAKLSGHVVPRPPHEPGCAPVVNSRVVPCWFGPPGPIDTPITSESILKP